eukprot:s539_g27.t2
MHSEGFLWGSVWEQVQLSRMCAAALMPRSRALPPYYMTTSCRGLPSQWWRGRRDGICVQVQVSACYRGLQGLHRLQEGHLAIVWRSGQNQELWTGYGRVTHIDSNERMKRKTQLCWHYEANGSCSQHDCWFAHGEHDVREELVKATITLSKCSADSIPDWAADTEVPLDVFFAAIYTRDLRSLKGIKDSANIAKDHQKDGRKSIINRLLFKAGGLGVGGPYGPDPRGFGLRQAPRPTWHGKEHHRCWDRQLDHARAAATDFDLDGLVSFSEAVASGRVRLPCSTTLADGEGGRPAPRAAAAPGGVHGDDASGVAGHTKEPWVDDLAVGGLALGWERRRRGLAWTTCWSWTRSHWSASWSLRHPLSYDDDGATTSRESEQKWAMIEESVEETAAWMAQRKSWLDAG